VIRRPGSCAAFTLFVTPLDVNIGVVRGAKEVMPRKFLAYLFCASRGVVPNQVLLLA